MSHPQTKARRYNRPAKRDHDDLATRAIAAIASDTAIIDRAATATATTRQATCGTIASGSRMARATATTRTGVVITGFAYLRGSRTRDATSTAYTFTAGATNGTVSVNRGTFTATRATSACTEDGIASSE
jgi:hypothetical protein